MASDSDTNHLSTGNCCCNVQRHYCSGDTEHKGILTSRHLPIWGMGRNLFSTLAGRGGPIFKWFSSSGTRNLRRGGVYINCEPFKHAFSADGCGFAQWEILHVELEGYTQDESDKQDQDGMVNLWNLLRPLDFVVHGFLG